MFSRPLTIAGATAVAGLAIVGIANAVPNSTPYTPAEYYNPIVPTLDAQRAVYGLDEVGPFTQRMPKDNYDSNLLAAVNNFRASNGLAPATESEALRAAVAIQVNKQIDGVGTDDALWSDIEALCGPDSSFMQDTTLPNNDTAANVAAEWLDSLDRRADLRAESLTVAPATVELADGRTQSFMWFTNSTDCGQHPGNPSDPQMGPAPLVDVDRLGPLLFVDVNPNLKRADYTIAVEKKASNGTWSTYRTSKTFGAKDKSVVVLAGKGTYRVVVPEQFGNAAGFSDEVTMKGIGHRH